MSSKEHIKSPKVISLFSGCGGLDMGFERAGYRTIFATDNWPIACATLEANNIAREKGDSLQGIRIPLHGLWKALGEHRCLVDVANYSGKAFQAGPPRW